MNNASRRPSYMWCGEHGNEGMRVGAQSLRAHLFLYAQKLVVLRRPLASAWSTRLDLAAAQPDRQISDKAVLSLPRAVRAHHTPPRHLSHSHCLDRLSNRADLIHLEQQRVARLLLDCTLHAFGICHEQVVADHLATQTVS